MRGVFRDLNCAVVIEGGAGKNPATEDFVAAIEAIDAGEIIILPNNRNIELAAQQAADLVDSNRVRVVATRTVAEGVSAMIAFGDASDGQLGADSVVAAMREAARATTSIEVTRATRSTTLQGLDIGKHDYLAVIDGEIRVAEADLEKALWTALAQVDMSNMELATLYYGAGIGKAAANEMVERLMIEFPSLEYEAVYGGQGLYPLIVSVE